MRERVIDNGALSLDVRRRGTMEFLVKQSLSATVSFQREFRLSTRTIPPERTATDTTRAIPTGRVVEKASKGARKGKRTMGGGTPGEK